ncbi:dienelactone hydrolase family protein [Psychromonas sp. MME2]|uniref:dienelactone hydrolase family protein n=1 Tax=Psychromonas sp. MME2 TaxID=3231033 RepID=UPI00339CB331
MKAIGLGLALLMSFPVAAQQVIYQLDGKDYQGYFAKAQGTAKGSVLLIHDWDGLTEYEIKRADMLAKLGYNTFAADLYGKGNRPVETQAKKEETGKLYNDRDKMRRLIFAGINESKKLSQDEMVVMGYCFGGAAVLELARSGEAPAVKGYATFHGGLTTPDGQNYNKLTAPIFVAHGGADSGIPLTEVAELGVQLEAVKANYEIQIYSGAPHAFTVFGSERYQEVADKKSWHTLIDFLEQNLHP